MNDARWLITQLLIVAASILSGRGETFQANEPLISEIPLIWRESKEGLFNMSTKPSLQPKESKPVISNYTIKSLGKVCVRARLGVVYIVKDSTTLFFNLDPKSTVVSGYCSSVIAVLSLVFDGGNLQFTFNKNGSVSYVNSLSAFLEPQPTCKDCKSKRYSGTLNSKMLFKAANDQSFKCKSSTSLKLSDNLRIKIVPLHIQAFNLPSGRFGKEVECWADYMKRIVPIVVGAVVVGAVLIAVLVFVLMREHRSQGYEQL